MEPASKTFTSLSPEELTHVIATENADLSPHLIVLRVDNSANSLLRVWNDEDDVHQHELSPQVRKWLEERDIGYKVINARYLSAWAQETDGSISDAVFDSAWVLDVGQGYHWVDFYRTWIKAPPKRRRATRAATVSPSI